jgi:ribonuclease G
MSELADDIAYLRKAWALIRERGFMSQPPGTLLHQDLSLAERVLRDLATEARRPSASIRSCSTTR